MINGGKQFVVKEVNITDIIVIKNSGELYINGKPVFLR